MHNTFQKLKSAHAGYFSSEQKNYLFSLLLAFLLIYFPMRQFGMSFPLGFGLLGILWVVMLARYHSKWEMDSFRKWFLMLTVSIVFFWALPVACHEIHTAAFVLCVCLCCAFLLTVKTDWKEMQRAWSWVIIAACIFSAYIIFFRLDPELYLDHVLPHLTIDQERAIRCINGGYGPLIGDSISYGNQIFAFASLLMVGAFIAHTNAKQRIKAIAFIIVFLIASLFAGRRSELVALLGALLLIGILYVGGEQWRDVHKRYRIIGAGVGAIALGILILFVLGEAGYLGRFATTLQSLQEADSFMDFLRASGSGRVELWEIAVDQVKKSPIFGIGWMNFQFLVPDRYMGQVGNVHNTYLQFLCETGIVGTALLLPPILAGFIKAVRHTRKIVKRVSKTRADVIIANVTATGLQFYFLLLNLVDPAFYHYYYFIMLTISFFLASYARGKDEYVSAPMSEETEKPMSDELLRSVQEVELELLKKVQEICNAHQLRYYAIGGTCLGAVRHQGFIPWDDDIDIVMPYPDYVKFQEFAQKELPSSCYRLSCPEQSRIRGPFIKIFDVRTTFIEKLYINTPERHMGVFLDIFPIYALPNDERKKKQMLRRYYVWLYRDSAIRLPYHLHPSRKGKIFCIVNSVARLTKPFYYFQQKIASTLGDNDFDSAEEVLFGWRGFHRKSSSYKTVFPAEIFRASIEVPFENMTIRIPCQYDAYLRAEFGDYMQLPPIEKRVSTHMGAVIDVHRSYVEYKESLQIKSQAEICEL